MRFLFYLGHPAHYHTVSKALESLTAHGHHLLLVARQKDVLLDLLRDLPYKTVIVSRGESFNNTKSLITRILLREIKVTRIALRFKPNLMIGTDIVITHVGKLLRIPSLILNEDDSSEVPWLARFGFKYATHVLAPSSCNIDPFSEKQIVYEGFHELAYLHPNHFKPNRRAIQGLLSDHKRYFVLRFSNLKAHHDRGRTGITCELAQTLISKLSPHGKVYISSERKLEAQLEKYRLPIDPSEIHHALYYADLCVGDSQTMAAESAVLGTPSIRFNDFVGSLGYLEELEHRYQLTFGFRTSETEPFLEKIEELVQRPGLKAEWAKRREKMLSEKIDVSRFFLWLIENYPESVRIVRNDADFQFRFQFLPA